jgi:hypothetical protein
MNAPEAHNNVGAGVFSRQKVEKRLFLSFPRRRESSLRKAFWTPASAGATWRTLANASLAEAYQILEEQRRENL